jgi:hypothetical protein
MHDNILIASLFPTINIIFLLETITMLCGIDNIPWNIPHIEIEYGEYQNIPWNIVNPT